MLSVQALMDGILDYAGLFPPAKLDMVPTMRNYRDYREGAESWMLGRIVVPVGRDNQDLIVYTKRLNGKVSKKRIIPVRFVPMTGRAQEDP